MHTTRKPPQDTSALFSLQEIMRLEAERELAERRRAAARVDDERRAKEAEEARRREEEQQRLAAAEQQRREVEQRDREERARLEAMREGELERARIEAEHSARMDALRAHQEHERALTVLRQDRSKRRAKWIAALSAVACVVAIVAGAFVIRAQAQRTRELEAHVAGMQSDIDAKRAELSRTTSPEDRRALEAQIADLQRHIDALNAGKATPAPPRASVAPVHRAAPPPGKPDVCEEIRKNPNDPRRFDPVNPCL